MKVKVKCVCVCVCAYVCVHMFHSILIYTLQEKINTANGDVTKSLQINKDKVCIHTYICTLH